MFNFVKSFDSIKKAPIGTARELMKSNPRTVLVDVRNPGEFREERIKGSINIPLGDIRSAEKVIPDKDTPILVHCLSGARSATAAVQLARMGYTDITDLGGIVSWPYDTISG